MSLVRSETFVGIADAAAYTLLRSAIRAAGIVPVVILLASKLGMRDAPKVPLPILEASITGILAEAKVPLVILLASKDGISDAVIFIEPTTSIPFNILIAIYSCL